jgi:hypothetical protein
MAMPLLPRDFKEFLQLLNANNVEYLLVGGYAVGYYGYVRATADMDVWVACNPKNAAKAVLAIREFGFDVPELTVELLLKPESIVRMGVPPFRLEVFTCISGVNFDECYPARQVEVMDGIPVPLISLKHLRVNKEASGRDKDRVDLKHLPKE